MRLETRPAPSATVVRPIAAWAEPDVQIYGRRFTGADRRGQVDATGDMMVAFATGSLSGGGMSPHTRAMVAAAAHAVMSGKRVAGVHDHELGQDLRIAAEARGDRLQGVDGDRSAKFGGTIPDIYDAGDDAFVSLEIDGLTAQGYDRNSSSHYALKVTGEVVQLYDHAAGAWFAFSIQVA